MRSRAVVMVADRTLELRELEVPDRLEPGFALLRVDGNGLCGTDHDFYVGALSGMIPRPCVPGHETVGTIVRTTPEAERDMGVAVGDRVAVDCWIRCGRCRACLAGDGNHCRHVFNYSASPVDSPVDHGLSGGMADHMVLRPGTTVYHFGADVPVEDAVLFNPLANAIDWTCRAGGVRLGDHVLVLGAGQRGIACALAAREAGAARVIVTGRSHDRHKLDLALEFGATDVVDVERDDLHELVRTVTDGRGVDVAIDLVPGATETITDAVEAVRPAGTVVLAGVKGDARADLRTDRIWQKGLRIQGALSASPWSIEQAVRLIDEQRHPFTKLHSHVFGLEDAELAIQILGNEHPGEHPVHITVKPSG